MLKGGLTKQRRKDHDKASTNEGIDTFHVGNLRKGFVGRRHERRHGQYGGNSKADARRRGSSIEPERDPGNYDNKAWNFK